VTVRPGRFAGTAALAAAGVTAAHMTPALLAVRRIRAGVSARTAGIGDGAGVALTFDDGPNPASTPQFVEALATRGVKATFFLLGCMVDRAPELTRSIVAAGHEVALHGWSHRNLLLRGPVATYRELARARDLIAEVGGQQPRFFRPPYGLFSTPSLLAARRLGLAPVLWTCWGQDWAPGATAQSILDLVRPGLTGGATVLLHDSNGAEAPYAWRATLDALPRLLDECAGRGLRVGPLRDHVPAGR